MELRLPTIEQLREFYDTEMKAAFPPAELKPLSAIERMWGEKKYKPYCLYDNDGEDTWKKIKAENTVEEILTNICGLEKESECYQNILKLVKE